MSTECEEPLIVLNFHVSKLTSLEASRRSQGDKKNGAID